jgi:hypothetical protein
MSQLPRNATQSSASRLTFQTQLIGLAKLLLQSEIKEIVDHAGLSQPLVLLKDFMQSTQARLTSSHPNSWSIVLADNTRMKAATEVKWMLLSGT